MNLNRSILIGQKMLLFLGFYNFYCIFFFFVSSVQCQQFSTGFLVKFGPFFLFTSRKRSETGKGMTVCRCCYRK